MLCSHAKAAVALLVVGLFVLVMEARAVQYEPGRPRHEITRTQALTTDPVTVCSHPDWAEAANATAEAPMAAVSVVGTPAPQAHTYVDECPHQVRPPPTI